MKLRNKKTGEIADFSDGGFLQTTCHGTMFQLMPNRDRVHGEGYPYRSLADLNEDWEDYETKPIIHWYIQDDGYIDFDATDSALAEKHKQIGNYFETREEAEKAVEKLKAWKRLKDKGLKISAKIHQESYDKKYICLEVNWEVLEDDYSDVFICFGGKK